MESQPEEKAQDLQPVAEPPATAHLTQDVSLANALASPDEQFSVAASNTAPAPAPVVAAAAPVRQRAAVVRPGILDNPDSELRKVVDELRKRNGAGNIITADMLPGFNQIPTGVFVLDYSLLGGLHVGLAHQFYGWENVGKTSMILRIMRSFQIRYPERVIVFVPLEGTFDPEHARLFGVDLSRVLILQSSSSEAVIDEIMALYHAEQVGAVFLDSIPALVPKAIIDKSAEDKTMSEAARLATILFQKINVALWSERRRDHYVSFFATNQWRVNPGQMFGDRRYLPGGNHQKFFFTNFVEIKSKEQKGDDAMGQQVLSQLDQSFHIDKAKAGAIIMDGDFKTVISQNHPSGLRAGELDDAAQVATIAKRHGFITGGGGKFKVTGITFNAAECRTLDDIAKFLYANPDHFLALKQRLIADLRVSRGRPAFPPDGYLLNHTKLFRD